MNERIRDLKEQALIWAIETLDPDALNDNEWGVAIDAKFAELIVAECMNVLAESREVRQTAYYYRNRIAKHFGVEE